MGGEGRGTGRDGMGRDGTMVWDWTGRTSIAQNSPGRVPKREHADPTHTCRSTGRACPSGKVGAGACGFRAPAWAGRAATSRTSRGGRATATRWLRGGYAVATRWLRGGYAAVTRRLRGAARRTAGSYAEDCGRLREGLAWRVGHAECGRRRRRRQSQAERRSVGGRHGGRLGRRRDGSGGVLPPAIEVGRAAVGQPAGGRSRGDHGEIRGRQR